MKQLLSFTMLLLAGCVSLRSTVPEPTMVTTVKGEAVPTSVATAPVGPVHLVRIAIAVGQTSVQLLVPAKTSVSGISYVNARTIWRHGVKYFSFDVNVHDLQGVATLKAGETGEITVGRTRYRGTIEL